MNVDIVIKAIRIAEYAHRNRPQGPHHRKAPSGEDRPAYFVHLAEVAWILADAGCDHALIAAGYLHDVIEDCGYTADQLEQEIGSRRVRELVEWVTEPGHSGPDPSQKATWEERNANYLQRIKRASDDALNLSCADKTANIMDMLRWVDRGFAVEEIVSRDHQTQLKKFEALDEVFRGRVAGDVYDRFEKVLRAFTN